MQLVTDRLVLREFVEADWSAVLAYQQDPRYLRYYPWAERTEADARAFVGMFLGWQGEDPRRRFQVALTLKRSGRLVGNCGLRRKPDNDWEADIGYELDPRHWGDGYATEAAQALVDHGFRELGLSRISSWCIADNIASVRVLERLDFRQEGRLRRNEYFKDRWWDTLLYALLRAEWEGKEQRRDYRVPDPPRPAGNSSLAPMPRGAGETGGPPPLTGSASPCRAGCCGAPAARGSGRRHASRGRR